MLEGYALDLENRTYVRMTPASNGDLPCSPLGLRLGLWHGVYEGVEADWLRWIDESGNVLPTGEERAKIAEGRLEEEARQRAELERRLAEALAELNQRKDERSRKEP